MTIIEDKIAFDFDDNTWSFVLKYDEEKDFKNIRDAIHGTKAVDIIGILNQRILSLIEIKDFRGTAIENKHKFDKEHPNSLFVMIPRKARDTLAGIIGGARNSTNIPDYWEEYLTILSKSKKDIHVILWLEEDRNLAVTPMSEMRQKAKIKILNDALRTSLRWLTPYVKVFDSKTNEYDGLTIKFL
jgi:hypothetical protein